jgi:predicted alpha-1,2-mannosidase
MPRRRPLPLRPAVAGLAAVALAATALAAPVTAGAATDDLTALVNPFVGTQNFGNTFPGASAPFGMVQVSPDTGGQGGYDYSRNALYGFSQTHLSGVGCEVMGELPVMPTSGAVSQVRHDQYGSPFSHARETARPGYYQVHLDRYDVDTELTATTRTGWQRHTFHGPDAANLMFNTGKAQQRVFDSEISIVGDRRLEGRIHAGNFCAGLDRHTLYFSAEFDRPFTAYGTWKGDTLTPGSRTSANTGANGAWVTFPPGQQVVLKIGLSYTGVAGARSNLLAETGDGFDFDATRAALQERWNEMLHRIEVTGGSADRRTAFYTALYHATMHPNVADDADAKYRGFDGQVHQATGWRPYQNFSLWDTFRPQNQLLELIAPDVARDTQLSVLAQGREGGWLPRWSLANSETNIMTGDPVTQFLVEGWSKGLLRGYEEEAYQMLRRYATETPPKELPHNGRAGVKYYVDRGYIPFGLERGTDCDHKGGDNDCVHPASATQEYAAADAALSLMARGLGKSKDAKLFAARAQSYRNIWDASIKHFRPRTKAGVWLAGYDPLDAAHAFHEGGAYQYQWLVPQNPAGLVELMGGPRAAEQRLDDFFVYDKLLTDPAGTARNDWVEGPFEYYGSPAYNPNNEPDLLAPYMYAWVGAPHKTATVVRAALTLFTNAPTGMTGNDDLGTMSAWYVFSSIGLYPTMSGGNFFVLTSPQFERVKVKVGTYGRLQGGTVEIVAPGTDDVRRYITEARVGGDTWDEPWLSWNALRKGAKLSYSVSDRPRDWGSRSAPPSLVGGDGVSRSTVDAALSPAELAVPAKDTAQPAPFTANVLVQDDQSRSVTVDVAAPAGWQVTPSRTTVRITSRGLPVQADIALQVTVPAGTAPGRYQVTARVTSEGLPAKEISGTVVVRNARCASTTATSCAVDLSEYYNHDGTATATQTTAGNFDGVGWSFDADLLPPAGPVDLAGTTYHAPDATGTANNFVEARGQSILFPAGEYAQLRVVGSAHHGSLSGDVRITYDDGTSSTVKATMTDWASSNPEPGNTFAHRMAHRIQQNLGPVGPPVALFEARLPLTAGKRIQSISLPGDDRLEIYAITLVKPGAAATAPRRVPEPPTTDTLPTPSIPSYSPPVN